MKRSPLKRKTPLRTRPIRSRTARRKGYAESWNWAMERAGSRCEVVVDDERCNDRAVQCHHIVRRSQGGLDTADNLLAVCRDHHDYIHANVAWARSHGYIRSASTVKGS